ncbi:AbrB/MazE/SpoVT family DNA-binding domain-containing protein [Rhodohalobacter sp. 614A]|uniref:AbrB/MazE/SpoVT family DNA-binding domain-containing protein n=1 Tax=Rhodohalobacter sp. 614A TaxID=2908649 RepID=UPI001F235E7B|nr:AbrB/MazE/SpoVT family DNA-binding domain-containing protein [Rhodohalobacter sp. 614A]
METKIRKIGNSLGVTLPKQLIEELHLKNGDTLTIEKQEGNIKLKPIDPEFEQWAEAYRQANVDYKEVLKELAK